MLFFKKKKSREIPRKDPVKTFTFKPTGTRYECKFPCKWGGERQIILMRSKIGDPISILSYEWNGGTAFAVMNDRIGGDVGVVAEKNRDQIKSILNRFDVSGVITKFDSFGDDLIGLEVRLDCFERGRS